MELRWGSCSHFTLDRQIDQLVYDLYGLTDKEIAIVEDATRSD